MKTPLDLPALRFHSRMQLCAAFLIMVAVCLGSSTSQAATSQQIAPTMADVLYFMNKHRQLPEYAQVKLTETDLLAKFRTKEVPAPFARLRDKWVQIIGEKNWVYFHHYARGVLRFNEALSIFGQSEKDDMRRQHELNRALGEFEFIEHSQTDSYFPLWPKLYIYKSQIYLRLGQPVMANRSMQRAIELEQKRRSRP